MKVIRCPGPVNRREFLQVGASALGGLTLPALLAARAAGERKDAAVILLYLHGGPSHLETYDLKPGAPSEIPKRVQADCDSYSWHEYL
jgi:hypothetical protein